MTIAPANPHPERPPQRSRARRVAKWAGLVLSVLIAVAWVASLRWTVSGYRFAVGQQHASTLLAELGSGRTGWAYVENPIPASSPAGVRSGADWMWVVGRAEGPVWWWPGWRNYGVATAVWVPLWIPLIMSAIPTTFLWVREGASARRRLRAGQCLKCGYNRAGLAAEAVCPECGTGVAKAESNAKRAKGSKT